MSPDLFSSLAMPAQKLDLPPLAIEPVRFSIGQVRHVLRPESTVEISDVMEEQISSRRKAPLYVLSNGERLFIVDNKKVELPDNADGILLRQPNGQLTWLAHKELKRFHSRVLSQGLPAITREISQSWNGKFTFKKEQPAPNGYVSPENMGLRPPQIGALHSIGAHWSLSHTPATIVMPTGTGKTECMLSTLAVYIQGALLVVVPSDVLRAQTAKKFLTFGLLRVLGALFPDTPNPVVGIITKRPRSESDLDIFDNCNIVIGTMSALGEGNAETLAAEIAKKVSALIVDEAHHIGATGWSRFREAFREKPILQFTATPFRRDGKLVDGDVIYNYPLRKAQADGYFKKISFEPIYEILPEASDRTIANAAVTSLRRDLASGLNHLLMGRCSSIERATAVHAIYQAIAPDLNPMLVHSEMGDTDSRIDDLRSGHSRIVVCVNMLGEGFDLPELKIAAIHDLHKSLAVLLQFTGRFTRSSGASIGNATVIANIADPNVSSALERLYSEDADWNEVLSELSSEAAREHADLVAFLSSAQRLDSDREDEATGISHHLLRPTLSTLIYNAEEFRPKRFFEGLPEDLVVCGVWLHQRSNTLFFVTKSEPSLKWTRSKALRDIQWALFVLHFDDERKLLYLSSSDHSSIFDELAKVVGANAQVTGDRIFRTLGKINRLVFQNVGVKKHGRRNLRYAMYTGADVAQALGLAEQAGSVKSNLSGTGWEDGRPVTIGCSYKGRVWSREAGPVPRFVSWSEHIGAKIINDEIDTRNVIANVLIPEECTTLPDSIVLSIEWPMELLSQSEDRVSFSNSVDDLPLSQFELQYADTQREKNRILFDLTEARSGTWARYAFVLGGAEGYIVERISERPVVITIGANAIPLEVFLTDYAPLIRFVDLSELDGNLLVKPNTPRELTLPEERFETWVWTGVDITKESIWKDGVERRDSVEWFASRHYIGEEFDVVFDDDSAGEAADLICIKDCGDYIRLLLAHCKYSSGEEPGARVKDVVEVCSQAIRSSKWKWKFRDLCHHIHAREAKLTGSSRGSRYLVGGPSDVNKFSRLARLKELRVEIVVVQPGLSKQTRTQEQNAVLAAALSFLKETIGVDLDVVCSD